MASYFFDSSALFKRYLVETGTAWVLSVTDPATANDIYVVLISGVEIVSAIIRQNPPLTPVNLASALADFRYDFQYQYQRLAITDALVARAMTVAETHRLRGYDAVQLAAAVEVHIASAASGLPLTFVSADQKLNAAAVAEGLTVDDPTLHP